MSSPVHDFTGYQVLVVGGTRGTGHTIASAFVEAGADVTVTGTMMLPELYDADLTGMAYESVNLARQESVDHLVASIVDLDVLVLAAGANLPYGLPDDERVFIGDAVRSGVLGPTYLTRRLRLKLGQSPALGGGCVLNTGATRRWLELAGHASDTTQELIDATERAAERWAGIGIRVNSIVETPRGLLPRQMAPASRVASAPSGSTLLRTQPPSVESSLAESALFLASESASRISGQTLRVS